MDKTGFEELNKQQKDAVNCSLGNKLILAGVGHFRKGMENLQGLDLVDVLNEKVLIDKIEDKIRRGVIDENIVASELGAVLKDIRKGYINSFSNILNFVLIKT